MKTVTILCDNCNADLNDAGAMPTYRLCLKSEAVPNSGGIMYSVMVYPLIAHDMYFCGLGCLNQWVFTVHPHIYVKASSNE